MIICIICPYVLSICILLLFFHGQSVCLSWLLFVRGMSSVIFICLWFVCLSYSLFVHCLSGCLAYCMAVVCQSYGHYLSMMLSLMSLLLLVYGLAVRLGHYLSMFYLFDYIICLCSVLLIIICLRFVGLSMLLFVHGFVCMSVFVIICPCSVWLSHCYPSLHSIWPSIHWPTMQNKKGTKENIMNSQETFNLEVDRTNILCNCRYNIKNYNVMLEYTVVTLTETTLPRKW